MPPKTSQKRSRESTGTATKLAADAATAAGVAAPGSAPLLRRGRSSSVTSQEEGNADNDDAPRPKRSKRDRNSGRESGASDASMGEEDMDVEGKEDGREEKEQDVGNGRAGGANASSKRAGAVKKSTGGRRRASAASAAVAGGGPGEVSLVIAAGKELAADSTFAVVFWHDAYYYRYTGRQQYTSRVRTRHRVLIAPSSKLMLMLLSAAADVAGLGYGRLLLVLCYKAVLVGSSREVQHCLRGSKCCLVARSCGRTGFYLWPFVQAKFVCHIFLLCTSRGHFVERNE